MANTYWRISVDDRGIRRDPFLFFFGPTFDLKWEDIVDWTAKMYYIVGEVAGNVRPRLQIRTAATVHDIEWGGSEQSFDSLVQELQRRIPEKNTVKKT